MNRAIGKRSFLALLVVLAGTVAAAWAAQESAPADATSRFPRDPDSAQLFTSDIDGFWRAYEQAGPNNAVKAFQEEYIEKGTIGLRDFVQFRIGSAAELANWVARHPLYYASIRASSLRVASFVPEFRRSFRRLKEIYPPAVFPNVYFVIGRMSSAGTVSYNGLLIGTEMNCRTPDMPTSELTEWYKQVLHPVEDLPGIVAHELTHFEQKGPDPPTLLGRAIREGSADFVGESISGMNINSVQLSYGRAHERELWSEFQKVMDGSDSSQWLYNGARVKDRPADLGYFMGYQISRAYYQNAPDKQRAIREIIEVQDYEEFLKKSGYAASAAPANSPLNHSSRR